MVSTSPGPGDDLPPVTERLRAALAERAPEPDWNDFDAVVEHIVESYRPYAGPSSFDEAAVREAARRMVERTPNRGASAGNHWILEGANDVRPRLGDVRAPALVIHGSEDPLFPPAHGEALAREIPSAELLLLEGVGHQAPPRSTWDVVVPAILRHTDHRVRFAQKMAVGGGANPRAASRPSSSFTMPSCTSRARTVHAPETLTGLPDDRAKARSPDARELRSQLLKQDHDPARRVDFTSAVSIDCSVENVFRVLSDFERYLGEWVEGPIAAIKTTPGETHVGSQFVVTAKVGPLRVRSPYEVLAWEPPHRLGGRGIAGPARFEEAYQLFLGCG